MKYIKCSTLFIAGCMILSTLAGCGGNTGKDKVTSYNAADYPDYVSKDNYKFNTIPQKLTMFVNNPSVSNGGWGDDDVSAWIKKTLNLDLDITFATTGGSEELTAKLMVGEKLPDFIVTDSYGYIGRTLIENGSAEPLDELAKEYYPDFMKIIPGGMTQAFSEQNGHFYHTAAWFADTERIEKFRKENNRTPGMGDQSLCLNRTFYEEMGSPKIETPDQLFSYLTALQKKHSNVVMPLVPYFISWNQTKDTVNFFYRMFGGADWLYDDGSGNIKICIDDPRYKQALQYMNKLYSAGILTKEALTGSSSIKDSTLKNADTFAYIGQDWQWFNQITDGDQIGSVVLPIEIPTAVSRDKLTLKDLTLSAIGEGTSVYITKDCENKKRAIEYLAFRYTDECQIAERFGIEGKSWERNKEDGFIQWTKECKDYEKENGWAAGSTKYGYNNSNHSFFCTIYATMQESPKSIYPIQAYNNSINGKYAKNERIFDMSKVIRDEATQYMYDQFIKTVNECIVRCVQSDTETQFEEEYKRYVDEAVKAKKVELEAFYTKTYKELKTKGY